MATFIPIGEPAHDPERQALRFLAENLPADYTVYGNPWLVERSGVVYELDAVIVAPHAVYVVEIKSYRGRIEGTDHDWYLPHAIKSPLPLARKTAQALRAQLKHHSAVAAQVWIESFVFLSATTNVGVRGPASRDRLHTRKTILAALQDDALIARLSQNRATVRSDQAHPDLKQLLSVAPTAHQPLRRVREYEVLDTLDHQEHFSELLARHSLSGVERVLRVYTVPTLADDALRQHTEERARWEAQVLSRLGRCPGVLSADPPFADEAGVVLPLERFDGVSLTTWLDRYGPAAAQKAPARADLQARTDLWLRLAATLEDVHRQGVVHRLLRPEVILCSDAASATDTRVTGFDLAKQLHSDATARFTSLTDERLRFAAPEVVATFSDAQPASDQFSLGALLALLLCGRPLFDSTRQLLATRRLLHSAADLDRSIPRRLDAAVTRMLALRPTDRFPSLAEAIVAVREGREPETRANLRLFAAAPPARDLDALQVDDRLANDYQIRGLLGQGGMAVVYAALHLISGRTRALKIARADRDAEEALRGEYDVLSALDHPNIVKVIDLNKIEDRLTLVMERVSGVTLRRWLSEHPDPDAHSQRRLAEDLLAAVSYLEQRGVTHKDIKPDNLLVADGQLILIDFSLARIPEDAAYAGTPLYRDPQSDRWSHGTDRYAAALCLFELYAGRHAFDGRVPEPGQPPSVGEDDIDPPGLCRFFQRALSPSPEQRYPSARALREALLIALGEEPAPPPAPAAPTLIDASTPLRLSGLPSRAINALSRGQQIQTVGQLLAMPEARVRAIHAIGKKTTADILAFQAALRARGVAPSADSADGSGASLDDPSDPPLLPALCEGPLRHERLQSLSLPAALASALVQRGLTTIGQVAALTRSELLDTPGIGRGRLAQVVEALHQRLARAADQDATPNSATAHTLDGLWERAARPLPEAQRQIIERAVGLLDDPQSQGDIARDLKRSQSQISGEIQRGLLALDQPVLADLARALDGLLDGSSGIIRLHEAGQRFEEAWPAGVVRGAGMLRLLCQLSAGAYHLLKLDGVDGPILARPAFDRDTLRAFCSAVVALADKWPPQEADSARRTLSGLLPHYSGDPLALGVRLCHDVQVSSTGQLFTAPLYGRQAIDFVIQRASGAFLLSELETRIHHTFGEHVVMPEADEVLQVLRELGCQVKGSQILLSGSGSTTAEPGRLSRSVVAAPPLPADEDPPGASDPSEGAVGQHRSPEQVVRDLLIEAQGSRGFRMLVVPPERHGDIARSVAAVLGGRYLSFEDAFFTDHAHDLPALERAERFPSQREALTEAAEHTLFRLLDEHGRPGQTLVLGDTALWGLCEALDLPRRLYDQTLSGAVGFWVLVVPGVIHNRQPRWNEGPALWHLAGATLPLLRPLS